MANNIPNNSDTKADANEAYQSVRDTDIVGTTNPVYATSSDDKDITTSTNEAYTTTTAITTTENPAYAQASATNTLVYDYARV